MSTVHHALSGPPHVTRIPVVAVLVPTDRARRIPNEEAVGRLALSLQDVGLLMPIGITHASVLIFGGVRLAAAKKIGWDAIDAIVFDPADDPEIRRLMEWEENDARRALTLEEQLAFKREVIDPMRFSSGRSEPPNRDRPHVPRTSRDLVQHYLGVSGRTMEKFERIARWSEDAALPEPLRDEAQRARERANILGKVDGEFKRVRALIEAPCKDETVEQELKISRAFNSLEKLLDEFPADLIAASVSPGTWMGIAAVLRRALEWGQAVGASRRE